MNFEGYDSCTDSAVHGTDFELIPTVKMESRHPVEGPVGREFSSIYIVRSYRGLKSLVVEHFGEKLPFLKNDPLRGTFQNYIPKVFTVSPIHVLCANFVKFSRREVGEIARCLPDEKIF